MINNKTDEEREMPRIFKLWMEITGEDLWNEKEKEGKSSTETEVRHERR